MKYWLFGLVLVLGPFKIASAPFEGGETKSQDGIPNVVFVLADDMGWGSASYQAEDSRQFQPGAGGTKWVPNPAHTPNLDSMSKSKNSFRFDRFYAGSAVCSPTRSSILSGRTPNRECITGVEGCGQEPAWSCADNLPFPPTTFTVAEAAKRANMSTLFVGKWHLGNFFPKPSIAKKNFVNDKWPVSHPGMHGFDEWMATEASASSSMCNCGCKPEWVDDGEGCVIGGGKFQHHSYNCTNYWMQRPDNETSHLQCRTPESTLPCVTNYTEKIPGDDSMFILDKFEDFLERRDKNKPFLTLLFLHTVHQPHPAMPEYYFAYNDTYGNPAGDYLGTLTQMDAAIGRLRRMLSSMPNTMLWFTSDNGPHPSNPGGLKDVRQATNGLRQCKQSLFEGGIRVPGIVEWPAKIKKHKNISIPVTTMDFLPTLLDAINVPHEHPEWHKDGESLLRLLNGDADFKRTSPIGFTLGGQTAMIDASGRFKAVLAPEKGMCDMEAHPKYKISKNGVLVFDLLEDPTETTPIVDQAIISKMAMQMEQWKSTIKASAMYESQCMPKSE